MTDLDTQLVDMYVLSLPTLCDAPGFFTFISPLSFNHPALTTRPRFSFQGGPKSEVGMYCLAHRRGV